MFKTYNSEFPDPETVLMLKNENQLLSNLSLEGVRKLVKKTQLNGKEALVFEYIPGSSLEDILQNRACSLREALQLALGISTILENVHQAGIVHRDLNPANIIIDNEDKPWIIDFGISTKPELANQGGHPTKKLQGNLLYISPEQTGRINRLVDFRSDLYALGVIFYQMLTGKLPFESKDPMELIHCHLAVNPIPPNSINSNIPDAISSMVIKLLQKNADNRYQSSGSLKTDLLHCIESLDKTGDIPVFEPGSKLSSGRFIIPQKLYGRESDLEPLVTSLDKLHLAKPNLILIAGEPGVGKSALIKELQTETIEKKLYHISGKFDQYQRNIPYYAIQKALSEWVQILLSEPEEKLQYWKNVILESTGDLVKLVVDLIPELKIITGTPPEIRELYGQEAQNRFNFVFSKFITAISVPEAPLVIFIDDLQWADSASLELIKLWAEDTENRNMLLIGAYRDNEITDTHPLQITISQLEDSGVSVKRLKVVNLSSVDVEKLVSDTLDSPAEKVRPLAKFIFQKTDGNPIFVRQFLTALHKEELLKFDQDRGEWQWDLEVITNLNFSDNIVDLMMTRIRKLPESCRNVVKIASCIGSDFTLKTLSLVLGKDQKEIVEILKPAIEESLIYPRDNYLFRLIDTEVASVETDKNLEFSFIHDRIHQAFYALFPEKEKKQVHLQIGRLLFEKFTLEKQDEKIFNIAFHLNTAKKFIEVEVEKVRLSELNLLAAKKAIGSSAYSTGLTLVETACSLLPANPWKNHYRLTFDLKETGAEAAYLLGEFEKMNDFINEIIANAASIPEQKKVYMLRIDHLTAKNLLPEALNSGLEILEKLGVEFPTKPSTLHVIMGLMQTKFLLRKKKPEDLKELPLMSDPNMIAALPILERIVPPAYMSGSNYFPLIVFKMVKLSVKYGNMPYSAFGYASYGISLSAVLSEFDNGYRFGQLALDLVNKMDSEEYRVKVLFVTDCFLNHWKQHLRLSIDPLLDSFQSGMKVGNLIGGVWAAFYHLLWQYLTASELSRLGEKVDSFRKTFEQLKQHAAHNRTSLLYNTISNLTSGKEPGIEISNHFNGDEKALLQELHTTNDKTTLFFFHSNKVFLHLLRNEYEKGIEHSIEARKFTEAVLGLPELTFFTFYETILLAYDALEKGRVRYRRQIKKNLKNFKKWARTSPANYLHMYLIIDAIRSVIKGNNAKALIKFDEAIQSANSEKYHQIEAIGCEIAGRYLMSQGLNLSAQLYLNRARKAYNFWGATSKAMALDSEFEFLGEWTADSPSSVSSISSDRYSGTLDLHTLLKASTTISSEIRLENLLQTLLKILIENAGAENSSLIVDMDGQLNVVASGNVHEVKTLTGHKLEEQNEVPASIVLYCFRTGEDLILPDASSHLKWSADPYIRAKMVKSLMCVPIKNQGRVTAILYLENNLVTNAFTGDRVELLKLLSGQIAISLENSNLYHNLEEKVKDRTKMIEEQKTEIEKQKAKSDELLLNVMPEIVAEELKRDGKTKARNFNEVSVLFIDVVGFTRLAEGMSPQELVDEIDYFFSHFDQIISKYKLEKIKTIGDAYLTVGGLPETNKANAKDVVCAALEIQDFMKEEKAQRIVENRRFFEVRAGIHTGSVTSGVVGLSKFQYDIWGDSVNTAARIEQSSEPGKVNVSEVTYQLVKDHFNCEYRGEIEAKNKGLLKMYYVDWV